MIPGAFDYAAPDSVAEAITLLQQRPGEGKIIAGGQSLLPMMKLRLALPGLVVDLRKTRGELSHISTDGKNLRIGAMTSHAYVAGSDVVLDTLPVLGETAAEIADVQVRNLGTIGGSIAHADPVADYPATLLALDAQAQIAGPNGVRVASVDELIMDAFISTLAEDEIITEIIIPSPKAAPARPISSSPTRHPILPSSVSPPSLGWMTAVICPACPSASPARHRAPSAQRLSKKR